MNDYAWENRNRRNVAYLVALRLKFEKTLFRAFKKLYIKQGKQIAKQYELNGIDGAIGYINQSDLDVQNLMRSFYEKSIQVNIILQNIGYERVIICCNALCFCKFCT